MSDSIHKTILIAEDEPDIRELVRYNLEQEGFRVLQASSGDEAWNLLRRHAPALLVLDLMLPGRDGLEICRLLRADPNLKALPIVILTAKAAEVDRVLGLEIGADDYVTKPFSPRELVARIKAVLRRVNQPAEGIPHEIYEKGRLRIDFDTYEVWIAGQPVHLSLREFELLKFFVRNPNRVFDRLRILDLVWGHDTYVEPRTVDVHVRRLRKHVERNDAKPELILTVRGVGYKFDERPLELEASGQRGRQDEMLR